MKRLFLVISIVALLVSCGKRVEVVHLNNLQAEILLHPEETLLLPMEDAADEVSMTVIDTFGKQKWTVRLAKDTVDYLIPFTAGEETLLKIDGLSFESEFYRALRKGRPQHAYINTEPYLHFKPLYGWMNDPNGMFYKDGLWHLFYQYNPFGSKWGNMSWGHAVSRDLVHWEHKDVALVPDSLGMIFSGCAVVDSAYAAGFGADAVIAVYTSAGEHQSTSLAYSTDSGETFVKYAYNPVLTSDRPDFRDPKIIRHERSGQYVMAVSAGNAMEFYVSENLRNWSFASRFGEGAGNHGGVWECPDLFPLSYCGKEKWVLICSCNRNETLGSGTQYFIGKFDGRNFIPDDTDIRWLDYGTDFYAAVTFSDAPEGRRVAMAWENNWMYANELPLKGWRGMMTVPRELFLMEYDDRIIMGAMPAPEVLQMCGRHVREFTVSASNPSFSVNGITFFFDDGKSVLSAQRAASMPFSDKFDISVAADLERRVSHDVLVVEDDNSVECFVDGGAVCMTLLSF